MTLVAVVFAVIVGLMLAEARVSRAHEAWLLKSGAIRPAGDVFGAMRVTYPGAFLAMAIEGLWRSSGNGEAGTGPNWFLSGVLMFVAAKALKYWAIRSLGPRWTFKVIVLPGQPLVMTGPYRYLAHPNYVAVVGELVGAAMMCGAPIAGVAGVLAFGLVLWKRIQFEEGVLRRVREGEQVS